MLFLWIESQNDKVFSFGSGYRSADNSGGFRGDSLGQLSPQTSVARP